MLDSVKEAARGHWPQIHQQLGIEGKYLTNNPGPCPACHAGKDRFRYDDIDGAGTHYCNQCGAGDGFSLLRKVHGWTFPEALKAVAGVLGGKTFQFAPISPVEKVIEFDEKKAARIPRTWNESRPIQRSDPAWMYIVQKLGIVDEDIAFADLSDQLRFHPSQKYWDRDNDKPVSLGKFPTLVAAITGPGGELLNVQTLYLTADGKPASVPSFKKMLPSPKKGAIRSGAVKLHRPDKILGIAEGAMTALAVRYATGIPTWAAISAPLMKSVIVPDSVEEIIIFADNDESLTGEREALAAARKFVSQQKRVKIISPPLPESDWADLVKTRNLQQHGKHTRLDR